MSFTFSVSFVALGALKSQVHMLCVFVGGKAFMNAWGIPLATKCLFSSLNTCVCIFGPCFEAHNAIMSHKGPPQCPWVYPRPSDWRLCALTDRYFLAASRAPLWGNEIQMPHNVRDHSWKPCSTLHWHHANLAWTPTHGRFVRVLSWFMLYLCLAQGQPVFTRQKVWQAAIYCGPVCRARWFEMTVQ